MSSVSKLDKLREIEPIVYRMAYALLDNDAQAIEMTKHVLCQLWKDQDFFVKDIRKQQSTIIWLVSQKSTGLTITA